MAALADGLLAGSTVGEPYMAGPTAYWATHDSAQAVYSPSTLYRVGDSGAAYHAVHIPGNFKRDSGQDSIDAAMDAVSALPTDFYLIRDSAGESLFLINGSNSALLLGTGSGAPGLSAFIRSLIGDVPLDVAILDRDPRQSAGLAQLSPRHIYAGAANLLNGVVAEVLADGAVLDLGKNRAGQPLKLEVSTFQSDAVTNMALLNSAEQVLFAGNALEKHDAAMGRGMQNRAADDHAARTQWLGKMNARFKLAFLASNSRWFSDTQFVSAAVASQAPAAVPGPGRAGQ
jgi:hypothetical protein